MTGALAETTIVAKALENSQTDPFMSGLLYVLGGVILMVTISRPIMNLIKSYKVDVADNAKANAESALFDQLQKQITKNSKDIEILTAERNVWFEEATNLRHEVSRLQTFEKSVISMKKRLEAKDEIINERDTEIRRLNRVILEITDRLHKLEIRLARDELRFCEGCTFKGLDLSDEELSELRSRSTKVRTRDGSYTD